MASLLDLFPVLLLTMPQILLVMSFRNRFRRGNALRPVNRIKHVVDGQFGVTLNVAQTITLVKAVENPALNAVTEVAFGSTIHGIYLRVECYATTSGALSNVYMIIVKNPGGNSGAIPANAVGGDDDKRYVIHQEMVMLQKQTAGNPRTLFNGVVVIPRNYRRFTTNDLLQLVVLAPGVNIDLCIQCHYKEFR